MNGNEVGREEGRYVVYERSLLHSYRSALCDGVTYGASDDPDKAMGLLDTVLEYCLSGFVYDTEVNAVRDPVRSEGWISL